MSGMVGTTKKIPVWYPFKKPVFTYLVITEGGVPIFQYPEQENENAESSNTVLLSGFFSAINSLAKMLSGGDIKNMNFGAYLVTVSKIDDKLHVLLCDTEIIPREELAKRIHVEISSLYEKYFKNETARSIKNKNTALIFDPLYRLYVKQLKQGILH